MGGHRLLRDLVDPVLHHVGVAADAADWRGRGRGDRQQNALADQHRRDTLCAWHFVGGPASKAVWRGEPKAPLYRTDLER